MEFIPDGYTALSDALERIARHLRGDRWDQGQSYADTSTMREGAVRWLTQRLWDSRLRAFILCGDLHAVPARDWGHDGAVDWALDHDGKTSVIVDDGELSGLVLVATRDIDGALGVGSWLPSGLVDLRQALDMIEARRTIGRSAAIEWMRDRCWAQHRAPPNLEAHVLTDEGRLLQMRSEGWANNREVRSMIETEYGKVVSYDGHASRGRVVFKRAEFEALFAERNGAQAPGPSMAKAESDCRRWIADLGAKDGTRKRKADVEREARAKFPGLSGRGFARAWAESAPADWKEAGPKSPRANRSAK